jgi:hypothetical protein
MSAVPARIDERYADLTDRRLATALSTEDAAEDDGLNPLERATCYTHRRWLHHCVSSPLHVIIVTGHRWCRRCECAANVAIDEVAGDDALTCPRAARCPPVRPTARSCAVAEQALRQPARACR